MLYAACPEKLSFHSGERGGREAEGGGFGPLFLNFLDSPLARESEDRQTFDWTNSIKFKASLFAKHWTQQTLNECINSTVVILPIEKFKLLNQAYLARRRC